MVTEEPPTYLTFRKRLIGHHYQIWRHLPVSIA